MEHPSDRHPGERCGTCRSFVPNEGQDDRGFCTRRPRLNQKWDDKTRSNLWCSYYTKAIKMDEHSEDDAAKTPPPRGPLDGMREYQANTPPPMFDPVEAHNSHRAQAEAHMKQEAAEQSKWAEMADALADASREEYSQDSSNEGSAGWRAGGAGGATDQSVGNSAAIREVLEFLNLLDQAREMHTKQIMEIIEDDDRDHMTVLIELRGAVRLLKALTLSVKDRLTDLTK